MSITCEVSGAHTSKRSFQGELFLRTTLSFPQISAALLHDKNGNHLSRGLQACLATEPMLLPKPPMKF